VILAPVALVMAWGAVVGRSRAAAVALMGVGAAVLLIALAIDHPKFDAKRGLDILYDDVVGHAGSAFKLELLGAVLLVLAGGLALARPEARASEPGARRRREAAGEAAAAPPDAPPPVPALSDPPAPPGPSEG
jgi:hypothetical protein